MRWLLRSKIHKATVTRAEVDYVGSVTIDQALMEETGLWEGEKVLVVDLTNGSRVNTYVIKGERDSGEIGINGAAAHLIQTGDEVIIMGFELTDAPIAPRKIVVDKNNRFLRRM